MSKAAISLTTGLEDPEKVTVALLVAIGAVEGGRDTVIFVTKEAVRLATESFATGTACSGCPPISELMARYEAAGGSFLVCPLCFNSRQMAEELLLANAELGGTVQLWEWIGEGATTFSY